MAIDFSQVFPPELLKPQAKDDVIRELISLPIPPTSKLYLYGRWARQMGLDVTQDDRRRVTAIRGKPA